MIISVREIRWFQVVLIVCGLALVVAAVLYITSGDFRERLSCRNDEDSE